MGRDCLHVLRFEGRLEQLFRVFNVHSSLHPEDRRRTTHWACGIDRPCSQNGVDLCIQVLPRRKLPVALFVVGFICRGRRWLCRLRFAFAHLSTLAWYVFAWSSVQSVFERNRAGLHLLNTGAGCSTKTPRSKFGVERANFGGKGVARRQYNCRNSLGSGMRITSAAHTPPPWGASLPYRGTKHDRTMTQRLSCNRKCKNMPRERWYSMRRRCMRIACRRVTERRR